MASSLTSLTLGSLGLGGDGGDGDQVSGKRELSLNFALSDEAKNFRTSCPSSPTMPKTGWFRSALVALHDFDLVILTVRIYCLNMDFNLI